MTDLEMKRMAADPQCEYKPAPLVETMATSDKLLEEALVLAGLIRAALIHTESLEIPHRPFANMRDMAELHCDRMGLLRDTLHSIAGELGCR